MQVTETGCNLHGIACFCSTYLCEPEQHACHTCHLATVPEQNGAAKLPVHVHAAMECGFAVLQGLQDGFLLRAAEPEWLPELAQNPPMPLQLIQNDCCHFS